MTIDSRLVLAFCATAASAACAAGAETGAGGPTASSVPQVECPTGPLQVTEFSAQAQGALNRTVVLEGEARTPFYRTALEQAEAGIAVDADNAYHHYLAGQAAAGLDDFAAADAHLTRAAELCPALAAADAEEIETVRQTAWTRAFERGLESYRADDLDGAVRAWESASLIWQGAPNAPFNLAIVQAGRGQHAAAAESYRRVFRIIETLPAATEPEIATERLAIRAQALNGFISLGALLFQEDRLREAADVFLEIAEIEPNSRDAWYNASLALYRLEEWNELLPVVQRVVQVDPLNYNAAVILFNAHRGIAGLAADAGQTQAENAARERAVATLQATETFPVRIDGITIGGGSDGAPFELSGTAIGSGQAGGPVTLEFTAFGASGQLGTGTTTIERPAADQQAPFTVTISAAEPITGWRYTVR